MAKKRKRARRHRIREALDTLSTSPLPPNATPLDAVVLVRWRDRDTGFIHWSYRDTDETGGARLNHQELWGVFESQADLFRQAANKSWGGKDG
jgi:hypothetical protein